MKIVKVVLLVFAFAFAVFPLLSQTTPTPKKPSFDVISIKPNTQTFGARGGIRGGGARGDKYMMTGANLRILLQNAYQQSSNLGPGGRLEIIGGPSWMDSDLYDIQATADCSGGVLSREQLQLMIQSMLEDRFQLKAHMETRESPIYNLVVGKDGPKLKASADQTPQQIPAGFPAQPCGPAPTIPAPPLPPPPPGQRGVSPLDPNFVVPRGSSFIAMTTSGMALRTSGMPLTNMVGMLQQFVGRPVIDKTDIKGLFDITLQFGREGLTAPGLPPGGVVTPFGPIGPGPAGPPPAEPTAADPVPSLFTAIQELGLRLESSKGPVPILVIESVEKPTAN